MILLIYGSRKNITRDMVDTWCDVYLNELGQEPDVVITGAASGADTFGMLWANHRGFPTVEFWPMWNDLGKRAGFIRNKMMAAACTHAIGFWDGQSKGTQHMTNTLRAQGVTPWVIVENDKHEQGRLEFA